MGGLAIERTTFLAHVLQSAYNRYSIVLQRRAVNCYGTTDVLNRVIGHGTAL